MKRRGILKILIIVYGLLVCLPKVCNAEPIGTGFTYQGRLVDNNDVADGLYDLQFKLFDAVNGGNQLNGNVDVPDLDVIDGYFTVELDFGAGLFDGNARWLEIGVRPGELEDPNAYTVLEPRQEITPAPYALYAANSQEDSDWKVSANNMYSIPAGNVGIGTTNPMAKLHLDSEGNTEFRIEHDDVKNTISFYRDTNKKGYLEKDDDSGIFRISADGSNSHVNIQESTGNVGIGTLPTTYKLDVAGNMTSTLFIDRDNTALYAKPSGISYFNDFRASILYDRDNIAYYIDPANTGTSARFAGSIGIGGAAPSYRLDVSGMTRLLGNAAVGTSPSTTYQLMVYADNTTSYAGYFETDDNAGTGVGLYAKSDGSGGTSHYGVYGYGTGATANYGVYGYASGAATTNYGIYGSAGGATTSWAGYFDGNVYASNIGLGAITYPYSKLSVGGNGFSSTNIYSMSNTYGIYCEDNSYGIYCDGADIYGGYFNCYDDSGSNYGVRTSCGSNGTNNAYGVYSQVSRDGTGIYYSGYFFDSGSGGTYNGLYADVRSGGAIDLAEYIYDTAGDTEAGDVLAADSDNKESVIKSSIPYDPAVIGVVSTKPHLIMGMELVMDEETGEMYEDVNVAMLALAGRVPVKVTDENGPVKIGDLVTTSSKPGYAMKWTTLDVSRAQDFEELKQMLAENQRRQNAIIGKALETLESGEGKIMVLINSR